MKNRDFIITSLQVWDIEIGSTIKNTALELSKNNRVLYVNTPMDHATRLRGGTKPSYTQRLAVIKGQRPALRRINDNMWVLDCPFMVWSINRVAWAPLFDLLNRDNNRKTAKYITKMASELGFNDPIHIIDNDIYRSQYMKEYLPSALSIYYRRDNVLGESYWRRHGTRLEPLLCAKSDMTLANSLYYVEKISEFNPNCYEVNTGVQLEKYDPTIEHKEPADIAPIPHPRVGYIGSINSTRLDADLLLSLAKSRADYSFVFTGPEDAVFRAHELHTLPNVYFLGNKSLPELPAYIAAYDVCINPQMINDNTIGNYPLKIDEYLAMGKPVVATRTHTMEHLFSQHTHLADTPEQYPELIDKAVAEANDKELATKRIAFANTHSWEGSVKMIYRAMEDFLSKKI